MTKNNATEVTRPDNHIVGLFYDVPWHTCKALGVAYDNGCMVFEESELCRIVGITLEQLEGWLMKNWREQDIKTSVPFLRSDRTGRVLRTSISLVHDHGRYFTVRLFSLLALAPGNISILPDEVCDIIELLQRNSVRPGAK